MFQASIIGSSGNSRTVKKPYENDLRINTPCAWYNSTMRLVLDPAEDAAHGEWLRTKPGAYEWWYFDALSDDGEWALTCIWFLGNPFSPYYRLSAQGKNADPFAHNALFFALYRQGRLHAYHFTRFPRDLRLRRRDVARRHCASAPMTCPMPTAATVCTWKMRTRTAAL